MQNINDTLDRAIKIRDMESIRRALTTWILQDPGFTKGVFDEKLRYCRERGISDAELFVPLEGEPINENPAEWTERYFASAKTEFDSNFSKERLTHLRRVGQRLYPASTFTTTASAGPEGPVKKKYGDSPGERVYSPRERDERLPGWIVPAGIAAAAVILLWLIFGRK